MPDFLCYCQSRIKNCGEGNRKTALSLCLSIKCETPLNGPPSKSRRKQTGGRRVLECYLLIYSFIYLIEIAREKYIQEVWRWNLLHDYLSAMGRDVAQSVEHQTSMLLTQVRFPGPREIFLPESTFSADSLTVSIHPHVQSHALTSVHMLKIPQSMSLFGGLWKHYNIQHAPGVG